MSNVTDAVNVFIVSIVVVVCMVLVMFVPDAIRAVNAVMMDILVHRFLIPRSYKFLPIWKRIVSFQRFGIQIFGSSRWRIV